MKKINVAINGFGRIGRLAFKLLFENSNVNVVAINDLGDSATLAHLLQYDSVHQKFKHPVNFDEKTLLIGENKIAVFAEKSPEKLPWKNLQIDIVLECTGKFRSAEAAGKHITAGAKRVLISAPAGGGIKTIVLGINDHTLHKSDLIVSNASCTTNCLAPVIHIIEQAFGLKRAFTTTIHAYTADQNLQDGPHKTDMRRARAAAFNIVPTSTNAGIALADVLPQIGDIVHASAVRVPVIDGSLIEVTALVHKEPSIEEINQIFQREASGKMKHILEYTASPIVSSDIIGNSHSAIYDALLTQASQNMIKITAWYDNEYGYSSRLRDLTLKIAQLMED